jgi:hypothetical protein
MTWFCFSSSTRTLHIMWSYEVSSVYVLQKNSSGIQLAMVLGWYIWCPLIGITLQRSISYTLASFGRHCPPIFPIYAYVQVSIQTLSTYVGGANATNWGSWNLSISFTHGKKLGQETWIQIKFQFISLWKGCHQLLKMGTLKALVWFWWINKTLCANLFALVIMR